MNEIVNINSLEEFDEKVSKSSGVVMVDIWATWCGPCMAILPTLKQIHEESPDKVTIFKVDADSNSEITSKFGIRNIPTMIFFKDGVEVKRLIGAKQKAEIMGLVDSL